MNDLQLTVKAADVAALRRLLLRLRSSELSDLRRVQTQLSVYGDRRASMEGEPATIAARLALVEDLLAQLDAQR